jgi:hypothetical protein
VLITCSSCRLLFLKAPFSCTTTFRCSSSTCSRKPQVTSQSNFASAFCSISSSDPRFIFAVDSSRLILADEQVTCAHPFEHGTSQTKLIASILHNFTRN